MKLLRYIFISIGIFFLTIVAAGIYFAGSISSTYPPLKEYYFEYSIDKFENNLRGLERDSEYKVKITDTTGRYPQDYSIYLAIYDNNQKEYNLKYRIDKSFIHGERLEFSLIGVFDKKKKTGGYKKSETDVDFLIETFEKSILKKIK